MPTTTISGYPGLQRMKYPTQGVACYRVKMMRQGGLFQEYFPFKRCGSEAAALAQAKSCWKLMEKSFPQMSRRERCEIVRRKSPSGIIGVARITKISKGHKYAYWRANFTDRRGHKKIRIFSIRKYGAAEAKKRALKARKQALAALPD